MTSKIFIGGGGDVECSFGFDELFFSSLPDVSTILYVPTAMATTSLKKESCYDWFSRMISAHSDGGRELDFDMWDNTFCPINKNRYSAVYVGGGNTYHLLDVLRKNKMVDEIKKYLDHGGVYFGGSAGGIILGDSLLTVSEENNQSSIDHDGLGLLNGLSVWPHFDNRLEQIEKIKRLCRDFSLRIVAIPEEAGIIMLDDHVVAFGEIYIYENEKEPIVYSSGQCIR